MKILVTGGAGYVGTELCRRLEKLEEVEEIIVYDNLQRGDYNFFFRHETEAKSQKLRFVFGDILDSRKISKNLKGIDVVYHLAAKSANPLSGEGAHQFDQINHWGSAELSYALEKSDVKKLIYLSSTFVYGFNTGIKSEQEAILPDTFYGKSKYAGEKFLKRLQDKMEVYIFRAGNVYGYSRSMRFDTVINKFTLEAHYKNRITIMGDGEQQRAFIDIDSIARFLAEVIAGIDLNPGIYNLVNDNLSVLDIVDALKELYPNLETFFIAQNQKMNGQTVLESPDLKPFVQKGDLLKNLKIIQSKFLT